MSDIYAQLFDSYAHDIQRHLRHADQEALARLTESISLPEENIVDLSDCLHDLRTHCCEESFMLGIQAGLRLAGELNFR